MSTTYKCFDCDVTVSGKGWRYRRRNGELILVALCGSCMLIEDKGGN
jgi:hypothetical protein